MAQYLIYFNQSWVGTHSLEWFASRGPLANAVVEEIKAAGAYVYAAGVDPDLGNAAHADATSGALHVADEPYAAPGDRIGGLTIVDVADATEARRWAGKLAEACGWPQEVRQVF